MMTKRVANHLAKVLFWSSPLNFIQLKSIIFTFRPTYYIDEMYYIQTLTKCIYQKPTWAYLVYSL